MNRFEIRDITRTEVPLLRRDLASLYGKSDDLDESELRSRDWYFFGNPYGEGIYAGAFSGSKLLGVLGFTPSPLRVRGREVVGATLSDAITHPEARGHGVFSALIKHLVSAACARGYRIVFDIPNPASYRTYIDRLGFTELFYCHRFARPLQWGRLGAPLGRVGSGLVGSLGLAYERILPLRGSQAYTVHRGLPPDLDTLMGASVGDDECAGVRSETWLRWRLSRPDRDYFQVAIRDSRGVLCGWAAACGTTRPATGTSRLHVGDYWIAPRRRSVLQALMAAMAEEAKARGLEEIYTISGSGGRRSYLRSLGFLRRRYATPMVGISPSGESLEPFRRWEYRDADADVF